MLNNNANIRGVLKASLADVKAIPNVAITSRPRSFFFFSSRRRHTRYIGDWNSDVCSSDLLEIRIHPRRRIEEPRADEKRDPIGVPLLTGEGVRECERVSVKGEVHQLIDVILVQLRISSRSEERRVGNEGRLR